MKSKKSNIPMRRCVGCAQSKPQKELVRIALYEGVLTLDTTGRAKGRGVYLCRDAKCIEIAGKKRALQRSFKCNLDQAAVDAVLGEILNDEK